MNVVRQLRNRRAVAGIAISAALLLAACGGGSSKSATTSPSTGGDASVTTTTEASGGGGNGKCFTDPGKQTARVRFVNLFTNATYPKSDIDVYQGYGADDACGKKLATVKFGEASDYIDVKAGDDSGNWSTTAFVAGKTGQDESIINQSETWKGGEQVTIVFQGQEPREDLPPTAGGDITFFEKNPEGDTSTPKPVAGKAVLGIGASGVQYVAKDGAWVAGLAGQTACLTADGDTENTRTNIGGTSLVEYPVTPGSVDLGLFPSQPGTCTGTPAIGPTTIDAKADSRTFVFVYGSDAQDLKLLVLPVDE